MAPKRSPKDTKKLTLKSDAKKVLTMTLTESADITNRAIKAMATEKVEFESVLKNCDLESLRAIGRYLRHDKSNFAVKVEKFGTLTPEVVKMIKLRDYLDQAINKSAELVHDSIVLDCSDDDGVFDFEKLKDKVSNMTGSASSSDAML